MCGIAGLVHFSERHDPPSIDLLHDMIAAIRYRGPDEYGLYRDTRAGLANARLSIVDLATGQQPLANEDDSLWIVFNGEIFNYVELRQELERLGHSFRTHSDTEVVVHAYEAWGDDCFRRLNGQWALALWDNRRNTLVLSRDRIGICPLYVREDDQRVWFGSEIKAIFADPVVPRALDLRGLDQTFTYWTAIAPITPFRGILEVPPGSVWTYAEDGTRHEYLYWRPSYEVAQGLRLDDAADALMEKLELATRLRMVRADVPVGSYLSGGLDSSMVAWLGRKAKEGVYQTFSMRFDDAEYDETRYQRMMAATLDSTHRDVVITRSDIARVFPDVIRHAEHPLLRTAPAPLFLLSRLVRENGFKAVLTGEGSDEMLAGYDLFREAKIRMFWAHDPDSTARPRLFERLYPYLARSPQQARGMALEFWKHGLDHAGEPGFSHEPRWWTTAQLKRFFRNDIRAALQQQPAPSVLASLPEAFRSWDPLGQAQYLEVVTLLSGYLISSQGDRMLMANSVEGRFPFLDPEVMDFCNALPPEFKLAGLNEKFLLKRIARGKIPEEIIRRPKQPYRAPDAICFVEAGAPAFVDEMLSEESLHRAGIFDVNAVRNLYAKLKHRARGGDHELLFSNVDNMSLVGILSTQLLYDGLVARPARRDGSPMEFTTVIDKLAVPLTNQMGGA